MPLQRSLRRIPNAFDDILFEFLIYSLFYFYLFFSKMKSPCCFLATWIMLPQSSDSQINCPIQAEKRIGGEKTKKRQNSSFFIH